MQFPAESDRVSHFCCSSRYFRVKSRRALQILALVFQLLLPLQALSTRFRRLETLPESSQKATKGSQGPQKAPRRFPEGSHKDERLPKSPNHKRSQKSSQKATRGPQKAPRKYPEGPLAVAPVKQSFFCVEISSVLALGNFKSEGSRNGSRTGTRKLPACSQRLPESSQRHSKSVEGSQRDPRSFLEAPRKLPEAGSQKDPRRPL